MADGASGTEGRSFLQEYAGLGFLLAMNTGAGIVPVFFSYQDRKSKFHSSVLSAFIDETIQLFVEGRSGQITDVWLDMAGIYMGS